MLARSLLCRDDCGIPLVVLRLLFFVYCPLVPDNSLAILHCQHLATILS